MADAVDQAAAADGADQYVWGRVVGHLGGDFVHHGAVAGPDVGVVEGGRVDCCAFVLAIELVSEWEAGRGRHVRRA